MKKFKLISVVLSVALLSTMFNFAALADEQRAGGTRTVYSQDFNKYTEEAIDSNFLSSTLKIDRSPFWGWLGNNLQNSDKKAIESSYQLATVNGREEGDKSLCINTKFNHEYGKGDGNNGLWDDSSGWVTNSNSGVHHKIMINENRSTADLPAERYLHISFSAAQDFMPEQEIGAKGAGLDMIFELWCNSNGSPGERKREYFHWYGPQQQYLPGADAPEMKYQVPMAADGNWVSYDYVFDLTSETMDIYTNGYPVVKGRKQTGGIPRIVDIKQINFQVRDIPGEAGREVNVYLDDINVSYSTDTPVVSPQSVFGVTLTAPEGYVDNEKGIIYNYGQSLDAVQKYLSSGTAYLVAETSDSTETDVKYERKDLNSLNTIKLDTGRIVNPILCVEDGNFTYCYTVKQAQEQGEGSAYSENFDGYDEWNEVNANSAQFTRKPFYAAVDGDSRYMETNYELQSGVHGREADDKSLHINSKFKLPYGEMPDGSTFPGWTDDRDCWVDSTNGTHNRLMSNTEAMQDDERYLHIAFSVTQDPMPPDSVSGEKGAGLNVNFEFIAEKTRGDADNDKEFNLLHWYNTQHQGILETQYQILTAAGKWVSYDYVLDRVSNTIDVYVNGCRVAEKIDLSAKFIKVNGIKRLNFQVRDINTGKDIREVDVYLDDVKVEYKKDEPEITAYSTFGERAKIDAPEKYIDAEKGIIYNNGQSLATMKSYIQGENKNAYLVLETADSTAKWINFEKSSSNSLDAVKMTDGRVVSPVLYVEDGYFTYCYEIRQPEKTNIKLEIADIARNSITLSWSGKSENCTGIEIFKDGKKIDTIDGSEQSYVDTDVVVGQKYEYCIREILESGKVSKLSETRSAFISSVGRPENFAVASVRNMLAVKLTWTVPKYGTATGYEIYRDNALVAKVGNVLEYTDSANLVAGTTYRYSVAAVSGNEKSDKTSEISIVADLISPPENVKVENADGDVRISWDAVDGAIGYEIYRNGVLAAKALECSYVLTDCANDSYYEFYVKAVNEAGLLSRSSEIKKYIKHNPKIAEFRKIFDDKLGEGLSYTTTNGAVIENGAEYSAIGTSGIGVGVGSKNFNGQSAGFTVQNGLNLSKVKNSTAEIRFLMYVPEGLDVSKLTFGVSQPYNTSTNLKAVVELNRYVKNTGWNFVRIPLKDLPQKGIYMSDYKPISKDFDYSKVAEIGFFSEIKGLAENIYFMIDEMTIFSNQPPKVETVKVDGAALANDSTISGKTNRFAVKFDSEMDSAQMSSDTMKVVCQNKKVPSVVEYDAVNDEYVICLLENLEANKDYSIVISNTLSSGGTSQAQNYTVAFKTDASVNTEAIVKTIDLNLEDKSGATGEAIVQSLDFVGSAGNEAVCGFDIEISYDSSKLRLDKNEVKLASNLKNSGITITSEDGKLKISRTRDQKQTISLKDGIGTFTIRALTSGSSQISADGKLYCYYSDTDAVKEIEVGGSAAISAGGSSGGSSSGGGSGGSGGGGSAIGGARPTVGGDDNVVTPPIQTIFSDISSVEWAREGILYLSENNIINGYEDNTFRPNNSITREEFVAIIVRAFGIEQQNADSSFADVNPSDWYYGYVSSAVNAGIIKGVDDINFGTGETISRQDMCTIMNRVIESKNLDIDKKYSKLEFSDYSEIADYAKDAVSVLQQMGVVNGMGDNMFVPDGDVTRAMAAKVVYQMIQGRNL